MGVRPGRGLHFVRPLYRGGNATDHLKKLKNTVVKEEEKEKLHLEQQQHYYTSLRKNKSAKFITLLLQG